MLEFKRGLKKIIIGIDIDDTICSTSKMIEIYQNKYIKENNITIKKLWSEKEIKDKFLTLYLKEIYEKASIKKGVVKCLKKLRTIGCKLYITTARTDNYVNDIKKLINIYLKRNNLKVDKIFINCKDKVDICKENNIDVMIDDNLYNYNRLIENNINTILFDDSNKYDYINDKVKNWNEVINNVMELMEEKL